MPSILSQFGPEIAQAAGMEADGVTFVTVFFDQG